MLVGSHRQALLATYNLDESATVKLSVRHQTARKLKHQIYAQLWTRTFTGKQGHNTYFLVLAHKLPSGWYHVLLGTSNASSSVQQVYFRIR